MQNYQKPASIIPQNDKERLKKLHAYEILDTPSEEAFNKIAKLAAEIFDAPSAFISFVDKDRVFFKANLSSLEGNEVERKDSLCSLAILEEQATLFTDTYQNPDLMESPHVSSEGGIRFYAGAPLKTTEGYHLGTICVTDAVPREASEKQLRMLETLSSLVTDEMEQRLAAKRAIKAQEDFMNMAVHDLKNPAANISLMADILINKAKKDDTLTREMSAKIKECVSDITSRLSGLLELSQIEEGGFRLQQEQTDLTEILKLAKKNLDLPAQQKRQTIKLETTEPIMARVDRSRVQEIFENLLSNAVKYSFPDSEIILTIKKAEKEAIVEFRDQGQGLQEEDKVKLFRKFARLSAIPTGKERSNGLGLSIVKSLVELHNGRVWATSEGKNKGASFFVALPL
jgi:signal transduction histidine kinase